MQKPLTCHILLLSAVLLAACTGDGNGSVVVDLGVIVASDGTDPPIEHPATAQSGVDIPVAVMTYGDDCTWVDRTEVAVNGLTAVVKPFDKSDVASVCADTIFSYRHMASIRFAQPGTATITVLGYDKGDRFGTVIERSSTLQIQ